MKKQDISTRSFFVVASTYLITSSSNELNDKSMNQLCFEFNDR